MPSDPAPNGRAPAGDPAGAVPRPARRRLLAFGVGILLLVLVRVLVVESFHVPSGSMEPTIRPGDRVVVTKIGAGPVERGDLIVFDGTTTFARGAGGPSIDPGEQDYLKRVAGVGGDTVSCTPDGGLAVNAEPADEPWLPPCGVACDNPFDVEVPPGRLFVLGDNRSESNDSRNHLGDPGGGMVPLDDVIGHVVWRYWPLARTGGLGD